MTDSPAQETSAGSVLNGECMFTISINDPEYDINKWSKVRESQEAKLDKLIKLMEDSVGKRTKRELRLLLDIENIKHWRVCLLTDEAGNFQLLDQDDMVKLNYKWNEYKAFKGGSNVLSTLGI